MYGEYAQSRDAVTGLKVAVSSAVGGDIDYVTVQTVHMWGIGIVQDVNAASMDLFISYRHFSADVVGLESTGALKSAPIEDADVIFAGSRIRF